MKRRIMSAILAFAMLISIMPSAFAYTFNDGELASGTTEETMPTLSLVCLQEEVESYYDSSEDTTYNIATMATDDDGNYIVIDPTELSEGDKFIVAIKATNYTNFTYNDQGLYQWSTGIAYDPTYIKYEPTYYDGGQYDYLGWDLAGSSEVERRLKTDNTYYKSSTSKNPYTITDVSDKDTESDADVKESLTNTVVMAIQKKATTNADLAVLGDEQYLAFIEFSITTDADPGTTVFDISESATDTTLQFGSDGTTASYTYNSSVDGNKLQEYLKLDTTGVDLFPTVYDVNFYESYSEGSYGDQISGCGGEDIAEGTTVSAAGITEPTYGTDTEDTTYDLQSPNSEGKYFAGWYYIDANGDAQEYTDDTVIGEDAVADGTTELKVYATWREGYTVTLKANYTADGVDTTDATFTVDSSGTKLFHRRK